MDFLLGTPFFYNNFIQNCCKKCRVWLPLETQFPLQNPPDFGFIQFPVGCPLFLLPDGGKLAFTLSKPGIQGIVSLFELVYVQRPGNA